MPLVTNDDRIYSVYQHRDPVSGIRYIGLTKRDPEVRWTGGHGYIRNPAFYDIIKKRGWKNIEHKILKSGLTAREAMDMEEKLIKRYKLQDRRYGANMRGGGFSNLPSEEVRRHLSEAAMGHVVTEETRRKIREHSPKRAILRISPDGSRKEFKSVTEAAQSVNGLKGNVVLAAQGVANTYRGFSWRYKDEQ